MRLIVVAALVAACSSRPSGDLIVSWRFVDGRDCDTAGAPNVEVRTTKSLDTMPLAAEDCSAGLVPATVTLSSVPGSGTLYLDAVTAFRGDLYHGELSLDAAPPGTGETRAITLYAVAAQ